MKSLSRVRLFVTPWTVAHQAPPSMEFPRQEDWMGCHFLLQEIFPTLKETTRQGRSRVTVKIAAGASVACLWFGDTQMAREVWEERVTCRDRNLSSPTDLLG